MEEHVVEPAGARNAASHDSDTPQNLIDFMSRDWIEVRSTANPHSQAARLRSRRDELSRSFPGEYLIVPAGEERTRANDTAFRFRPSSDFAYLLGDGEPGELLVMEPDGASHRSILFVSPHNRGRKEFFTDRVHGELWVGRHRGIDESRSYYGADRVLALDDTFAYLGDLRASNHPLRLVRGENHAIDAFFPQNAVSDELSAHLAQMRLVKDDYEIGELRKACEITKRGFEDVIALFPSATSEREIEAAFWRRSRIEGNDVGYLTIAASGVHACTLHWTRNDGAIARNALLLLDAGVERNSLYTADITRTLPTSGRFTAEQRAVYDLVWEAQRVAIEAVIPGADFLEPNRRAMNVLTQGLIDLRILRASLDEALDPENQYYRRYTLHNVSHMLGIDVHDCARARAQSYRYGTLCEGMVLTVEPGLYFQPDDATVPDRFRGIGVRIEDDIAVTASGHENLSAILPSQADGVERWVAEITAG
ncbi:MAG: aminopeptidase P family protein [Candidatus Eremiobacteraeota bacterium]|nr:aminopeptidase P family protein [Candidatus Eremiobacteraeota bacterium]